MPAHQSASRFTYAARPAPCTLAFLHRPLFRRRRVLVQYAVFTSVAASQTCRPSLRSPHQWSHILRLVRKSATPSMDLMPDPRHALAQTRAHGGHSHSHGHHHHHDNTYLTSLNRSDPGVRITRIGLYVNLGMAIAKGAGGVIFNSQALTADALHALTDLVADIMTLATISYSLRPATKQFPTGYGKIESLGALGVSGFLLTGGFMIGAQSLMALSQQFFPDIAHILSHVGIFEHAHHHGHSHSGSDLGPNINAAWLAGGSIVIKEWLYRATMKIAKQKRSNVLASNAYHHRVDSLTAFVALLTITASNFLTNAQWLDPVGGLIISGMIIQAGWVNTKTALYELADVGLQEDIRDKVENAAEASLQEQVGEIAKIKGVQGIKSGQNIMVEIEVSAPTDWKVSKMNEVETALREYVVGRVRGVRRVAVRFTSDHNGAREAFADEFTFARAADEDPERSAHDHKHTNHDDGHSSGAVHRRK